MFPICFSCRREMVCLQKKDKVVKDLAAAGFPSTAWVGDLWGCVDCGAQVVVEAAERDATLADLAALRKENARLRAAKPECASRLDIHDTKKWSLRELCPANHEDAVALYGDYLLNCLATEWHAFSPGDRAQWLLQRWLAFSHRSRQPRSRASPASRGHRTWRAEPTMPRCFDPTCDCHGQPDRSAERRLHAMSTEELRERLAWARREEDTAERANSACAVAEDAIAALEAWAGLGELLERQRQGS